MSKIKPMSIHKQVREAASLEEKNIIALCLTCQIDPASTGLQSKHFNNFEHRDIWSAITHLRAKQQTPDIITVSEFLSTPNFDWFSKIADIASQAISKSTAETHTKVIKERWRVREAKNIAFEMTNSEKIDINDCIKRLMELEITEKKYLHSFVDAADEALIEIEKIMTGESKTISTGLSGVDKVTGGLHGSDLIIVAARPAMGKTAFLLNMAAANKNTPLVFSTEQSSTQAMFRFFSIYGNVPNHKIRTGDLADTEFGQIAMSINQINESGGFIYDKSGPYMSEIEATARKVFNDHGCSAIYLDYLQRIKHENPALPNHEKVGDIAMRLKELARELDIPVIALAQVNREVEKRSDKRPGMGDIKDSGTIEQEADSILTLYRDEVYNDGSPDSGTCEVDFKKNRHGGTGMIRVKWTAPTMRFDDLNDVGR